MKLSVEIDLTPAQWRNIRSISLERMINNAINIGSLGERELKNDMDRTDANSLWLDFSDMKSTLMAIWWAVHNVAMTKTGSDVLQNTPGATKSPGNKEPKK